MTLHEMIIHDLYFLSKGNELKRLHVCHGIISEILRAFKMSLLFIFLFPLAIDVGLGVGSNGNHFNYLSSNLTE